jgi:hypothetical protein
VAAQLPNNIRTAATKTINPITADPTQTFSNVSMTLALNAHTYVWKLEICGSMSVCPVSDRSKKNRYHFFTFRNANAGPKPRAFVLCCRLSAFPQQRISDEARTRDRNPRDFGGKAPQISGALRDFVLA